MYTEHSRGSNSEFEARSIPAEAAVRTVDFRLPDGGTSAENPLIASIGPSRDNSPDKALILVDSADPARGTNRLCDRFGGRPPSTCHDLAASGLRRGAIIGCAFA